MPIRAKLQTKRQLIQKTRATFSTKEAQAWDNHTGARFQRKDTFCSQLSCNVTGSSPCMSLKRLFLGWAWACTQDVPCKWKGLCGAGTSPLCFSIISLPIGSCELATVILLLPLVVTALVQAPMLWGDDCLYGFQADEVVCVESATTGVEVAKILDVSVPLTTTSAEATTASSNTSWLPSLSSGELFVPSLGLSFLLGAVSFAAGACTAMLLACSMVGHSDEDDDEGIAA